MNAEIAVAGIGAIAALMGAVAAWGAAKAAKNQVKIALEVGRIAKEQAEIAKNALFEAKTANSIASNQTENAKQQTEIAKEQTSTMAKQMKLSLLESSILALRGREEYLTDMVEINIEGFDQTLSPTFPGNAYYERDKKFYRFSEEHIGFLHELLRLLSTNKDMLLTSKDKLLEFSNDVAQIDAQEKDKRLEYAYGILDKHKYWIAELKHKIHINNAARIAEIQRQITLQ